MGASSFIARKLRFKGRVAVRATAISSFVMIVAVSISAGYREEIRKAVSEVCADAVLTGKDGVLRADSTLTAELKAIDGVESVNPVIGEPGIIKSGDILEGVMFKGVADYDEKLGIRIPQRLAKRLGKDIGDELSAYFITEKVKARKFRIAEIYDSPVELDRNFIVYCRLEDMQRVMGMAGDESQAVEVRLDSRFKDRRAIDRKASEIGFKTGIYTVSGAREYASIFDWLQLIDMNVAAILLLMALVAAFNMISGLLIMIMRSTTTIGTLKAIGMDNSRIAATFLRVASRSSVLGLLAGNAAALLFCLVQGTTHLLKLDPANYFVSYVPVSVDLPAILVTDIAAWGVITLLMLLPSMLISRIDPARSIKGDTI